MPLAKTVLGLIGEHGDNSESLLVVHTHRHLDHRAGDNQFAHLANVQIVGFDLASIRRYYKFAAWPDGLAQIEMGDRIIDVIATPGHSETELCFYDRQTGLLFSGDFLMPGRLLIQDAAADLSSAHRLVDFVRNRPVSFILGGHIEQSSDGTLFAWGSNYHPHEHLLQMRKADLLALPAALAAFNGFYTHRGQFTIEDSTRILIACGFLAIALIVAVTWTAIRCWRHRREARRLAREVSAVSRVR